MDHWHLEKAAIIRQYVTELKAWIYAQEEGSMEVMVLGPGREGEQA